MASMASTMASHSKKSSETFSSNSLLGPSVLVSNDLMAVIHPNNTQKKTHTSLFARLTMDELLMRVKNYIVQHQLFDVDNPLQIVLHENELGTLLEKSEFSLHEFKDILLLKKLVIPVPHTHTTTTTEKNSSEGVICSINDKISVSREKRKLDCATEFSAKKIKFLDEASCDSDESIYSLQNYETECVNSDDNFRESGGSSLIIAETFDVEFEYQIEANSHTDDDFSSCESDSDLEGFVKSAIINFIAQSIESDVEYLADGSSDDDDPQTEKEISEEDKWCCLSCHTLNNPLMRNCASCWSERVGWMSEGDKRNGKTAKREIYVRETARENKRKVFPRKGKRKLSKKLNKNKDASPPNRKLSDLSSATAERNGLSSPSSSSNVIQSPSNILEVNKHIKTELDKQLCLFCCSNPADSTVIHGQVGCKICCFKCGKKLFRNRCSEKQRCPVCRRNIEKIVYLYNS